MTKSTREHPIFFPFCWGKYKYYNHNSERREKVFPLENIFVFLLLQITMILHWLLIIYNFNYYFGCRTIIDRKQIHLLPPESAHTLAVPGLWNSRRNWRNFPLHLHFQNNFTSDSSNSLDRGPISPHRSPAIKNAWLARKVYRRIL